MKPHDSGTIEAFSSEYRQSDAFALEILASFGDILSANKRIVQTPPFTRGCLYSLGTFKVVFDETFIKNGLSILFGDGYPTTIRFEDASNSNNYLEFDNDGAETYLFRSDLEDNVNLIDKNVFIIFKNMIGTPYILGIYSGYARVVDQVIDMDYTGEAASVYDRVPFNSASYSSIETKTYDELLFNDAMRMAHVTSKIYCGSKDLNIADDCYHYMLVGTFISESVTLSDGKRSIKGLSALEEMDNQKVPIDSVSVFSHTKSRSTESFINHFFSDRVIYDGICALDGLRLPDPDVSYLDVLTQICRHNGLSFWEDNEGIIHLTSFNPEERCRIITYDELFEFPEVVSVKNTYDVIECSFTKYYLSSDFEKISGPCIVSDTYGEPKIYIDEDGRSYNYSYSGSSELDYKSLFGISEYQSLTFNINLKECYDPATYMVDPGDATNAKMDLSQFILASLASKSLTDNVNLESVNSYESNITIELTDIQSSDSRPFVYEVIGECVRLIRETLCMLYAKPFTNESYKYREHLQGKADSENIYKVDLKTAVSRVNCVNAFKYISRDFNAKNKEVKLNCIVDLSIDLYDGIYLPYDSQNPVIGRVVKHAINYNGGITQTLTCSVKNYAPFNCRTFPGSDNIFPGADNILFDGKDS